MHGITLTMGRSWLSVALTPLTNHEPGADMTTATVSRHLYRITEAMETLSLSRTVIYNEMRAGRLHYVLSGSDRRITAEAIDEYIQLLKDETARRSDR